MGAVRSASEPVREEQQCDLPEAGSRPSATVYVTPLVGSVLSVIALAMVAEASGSDTFLEGIVLDLVAAIIVASWQ